MRFVRSRIHTIDPIEEGRLRLNYATDSGEAKSEYEERIQQLKDMAQPAKDKLVELRDAGESQWDKAAAEADKYYKALVHSFNYFKSQVK